MIHIPDKVRKWKRPFTPWQSATYSEGERKLPIGLAGRVQVDVLPLPALVVRALALRGGRERRDTNLGVRGGGAVMMKKRRRRRWAHAAD